MKKHVYPEHLRHPIVVALQAERVRQGITQAEVARRIPGVDQPGVSCVESGKSLNPGLARMTRIAATLGKDICLVDEEDYW